MSDLLTKKCQACSASTPALSQVQISALMAGVPGWQITNGELTRTFKFKNYHESMAFVNATAWVSHREDHHPDIELGYNTVKMRYSTHAIQGLSENDFICAVKINALMNL